MKIQFPKLLKISILAKSVKSHGSRFRIYSRFRLKFDSFVTEDYSQIHNLLYAVALNFFCLAFLFNFVRSFTEPKHREHIK